jgi:hypothetical protein
MCTWHKVISALLTPHWLLYVPLCRTGVLSTLPCPGKGYSYMTLLGSWNNKHAPLLTSHYASNMMSQNYWGFGFYLSPSILKYRGKKNSETGDPFPSSGERRESSTLLGPLKELTSFTGSNSPVTKSKTPVVLCFIHNHQNLLESTWCLKLLETSALTKMGLRGL